MVTYMNLPVDEIVMDPKTQSRVKMDIEVVEAYSEAMRRGDTFPAIVVFEEEGSDELILADGWFRTMAAKEAGIESLLAEVIEGTLDDAILHAASANETHGIRRTNEDKRKAVKMLLTNDRWKDQSNRQVAEAARVSHPLVAEIRDELEKLPTDGEGRVVIGKDGKNYKAKKTKVEKKSEIAQRRALKNINNISKLYSKLPLDPRDTAASMAKDDQFLTAGLAECIAWWFSSYAKSVREYTEDEDTVITVPDPVAK